MGGAVFPPSTLSFHSTACLRSGVLGFFSRGVVPGFFFFGPFFFLSLFFFPGPPAVFSGRIQPGFLLAGRCRCPAFF